jgi:hypothetical protein
VKGDSNPLKALETKQLKGKRCMKNIKLCYPITGISISVLIRNRLKVKANPDPRKGKLRNGSRSGTDQDPGTLIRDVVKCSFNSSGKKEHNFGQASGSNKMSMTIHRALKNKKNCD